jgi:3-oxoadipate enol-lactonase
MPTVERQGRTIHYSREGSGPGIVLVPGLGSGARLFGTLPRRFARAGFTCCAVDPVGLEPSGPLPGGVFDFSQAALDILAVASEMPGPVALAGTSLGGKVALQAAATQSTAAHKLVMMGSAAPRTPRGARIYKWFELLCTEVPGRLLGPMTAPFLFGATFLNDKPGVVDDIIRSTKPSASSRAFMQAQAVALQAFDGAGLAAQVVWPTLCLAGSEDMLTLPHEVEATAQLIPNAHYECIEGAGHSLLLESASAFDQIVEFVRA